MTVAPALPAGASCAEQLRSAVVARTTAVVLLSSVSGLLFWSVAPTAVGWQSRVVSSGSMAPAVHPGDVVLVSPIAPERLSPGQLVLFEDAGRPGRTVLHRVASVDGGSVVTKGDANQSADTASLPRADVDGIARLVVPQVGAPLLWAQSGHYDRLAAVLVTGLVASLLCSLRAVRGRHSAGTPPRLRPPSVRGAHRRRPAPSWSR